MRGAQEQWTCSIRYRRIIPADAGSTIARLVYLSVQGDHPRGCGEHSPLDLPDDSEIGSSPRMRGALACPIFAVQRDGIIPADAGSTCRLTRSCAWKRDHPRGCGEHDVVAPGKYPVGGSSPRMRGALILTFQSAILLRIIPADAGST